MRLEGRAARRNTKSFEVYLGGLYLAFSYDTCVAVDYSPLGIHARLPNSWGPTTGKHINEMGLRYWPEVKAEQLEAMVEQAIQHMGMEIFKNSLQGKKAA